MLTLESILTSSGKYPDRAKSSECTGEVITNAGVLLNRVNGLLIRLGRNPKVSSGFRTSAANSAAGGAKKSGHMLGKAVDLEDADGSLDAAVTDELLAEFDLYREDPAKTKNWIHLDITPRKNRTFYV